MYLFWLSGWKAPVGTDLICTSQILHKSELGRPNDLLGVNIITTSIRNHSAFVGVRPFIAEICAWYV